MVTRSQLGIVKPIDHLSLHTSSISPIPKSPSISLKGPQWRNAMYDEYNAFVKNATWVLVPRPSGVNMVRSMWLFKHKFHVDRTLSCYNDRLVANGSSQQLGIDCDETFSAVVKPSTIRTVLSLVVSPSCTNVLHQIISSLHNEFDMTDLEALNYFLGISATRHSTRLFLSQRNYAIQLLERAQMANCNPSRTPIDTESKLGPEGVPAQDPTMYRSLV
nr:ribonuclease H-like domain-containing protein [Tanacetum cinerariifolium]